MNEAAARVQALEAERDEWKERAETSERLLQRIAELNRHEAQERDRLAARVQELEAERDEARSRIANAASINERSMDKWVAMKVRIVLEGMPKGPGEAPDPTA